MGLSINDIAKALHKAAQQGEDVVGHAFKQILSHPEFALGPIGLGYDAAMNLARGRDVFGRRPGGRPGQAVPKPQARAAADRRARRAPAPEPAAGGAMTRAERVGDDARSSKTSPGTAGVSKRPRRETRRQGVWPAHR